MVPHTKEEIRFTIANVGKTGFYFLWAVHNEDSYVDRFKIMFYDQEGYVTSESEVISSLIITPLKNIHLKKLRIKLQVCNSFHFMLLSNVFLHVQRDNYDSPIHQVLD